MIDGTIREGLLDDAKSKVKALDSAERDGKKALRKTEEVVENRVEEHRRKKTGYQRKGRDKRKRRNTDIYHPRARQQQTENYQALKASKVDCAKRPYDLSKIRSELVDERGRRYILQKRVDILKKEKENKMEEKDPEEDEEKEEVKMCKPERWDWPGCEACTQFLDIADLHQATHRRPKKAISFGGTGYGLRVLATTVPLTTERASLHFDLYNQRFDDPQAPLLFLKKSEYFLSQ
ncbi:hypothetical protein DFQ28_006690 [Apophysomyces sp. BC1034]|nr:hypothetical protein DFQ29_000361 [Apophysomyces sp. BC1021]KAG0187241.1 hypothetical protein DFQ28_006690 [Apophysomyces sp. BC1034]